MAVQQGEVRFQRHSMGADEAQSHEGKHSGDNDAPRDLHREVKAQVTERTQPNAKERGQDQVYQLPSAEAEEDFTFILGDLLGYRNTDSHVDTSLHCVADGFRYTPGAENGHTQHQGIQKHTQKVCGVYFQDVAVE